VIYSELAATRQRMNGVSHVEPTGEETFDEDEEGSIAGAEHGYRSRVARPDQPA
jgi:hypothetical protein